MNTKPMTAWLAAATLALAACDTAGTGPAPSPETQATGEAVATVDGQPISQAQLDVYAARRGPGADTLDLVNDLISMELLAQSAIRDGLDRESRLAGELASQRTALLAQAAVRKRLEEAGVSDEAIAAEYERFVAEDLGEELNARHILVPDEAQARALIAELDGGADFAALAKEHSQDGSAESGGDLGWFEQDMMVEPFGERTAALEQGEYTKEPVQTRFGWHVIQLMDRRASEPPALDDIREEIRGFLQSQQIEAWVNDLRENAEVEILVDDAETPASE